MRKGTPQTPRSRMVAQGRMLAAVGLKKSGVGLGRWEIGN